MPHHLDLDGQAGQHEELGLGRSSATKGGDTDKRLP